MSVLNKWKGYIMDGGAISLTRINLLLTNQRDIKLDMRLTPEIIDDSIIIADLGKDEQRIVSKSQ